MLRLNHYALTSFLAICGTAGAVFANPNPPVIKLPPQSSPNSPEMKIPAQPTLKPVFIKQEVFADLGHSPAKADQSILLSASLKNKDGSQPTKGFKIKLSAGTYSCDAEVGNVAGFAACDVKIPFAVPTSNGAKSINVGKEFTISATIPPEIGNLTITSTRKFRLLSKEGYGLHPISIQGVNGTVLPFLNNYMPRGILFNNYKGESNPLLQNGSWLYLDKKDATKAVNFDHPLISIPIPGGLVTGDFYTNRVYVQPTTVSINNANGTFNLGFSMSGFDGSGPSIVGRCREKLCPDSLIPDFKNLRFDEASASYKLMVKNGKLRLNLVDSKVKLNFDCIGGFKLKPVCDKFKDLMNAEIHNQFQVHLKNPVLLAQIEQSVSNFLGGILALKEDFDGTMADFQICPPNSPNCNEGEILIFYVPAGK